MSQKSFLVFIIVVLLLTACAPSTGNVATASNTLSVTGVGQVSLHPDIAYVSIGVRTEAEDVAQAVSRNSQAVDRVLAALEDSGVSKEDLQTTNFSVYSVDQYDFNGERSGVNYFVENTVYVTVRDLDNMGDLLDAAVGAGANSIWGIQFDAADKSAAIAEAREMAMEDAKTQAAELANSADVTLGNLISVSYSQGGSGYSPLYGVGGGGGGYADSATTIVPGQISVSVNVNLSYEIR